MNLPFQGEKQPDTELFLQVVFFILSYLLEWWEEKRQLGGWGGGGRGNWSVFNNRENGFLYFFYVIAIMSI